MKFRLSLSSLAWAVRDIWRSPFEAILLFFTLALVVSILGTALLLGQAITSTAERILENAPAMVIRKINAGGWSPLPSEESIRLAKSVPGVIRARTRIWGIVTGTMGPVTIFGFEGSQLNKGFALQIPTPRRGQAVLGPGVERIGGGDFIKLTARNSLNLKVVGKLDAKTSLVAHDLILLHPEDVRQILAIPAGYASDLIVDVFHDQEVNAILPDLAEAFPWPVRISTRNEVANIYTAGWARRSGIAYLTFLPAILAIALIVVSTVKNQIGRRYELGLFKALGWTTKDLLRHQIFKSLFISIPAITCGMVISYGLVFWPGTSWPGYIFLGWKENPPALYLNASGAFMVLLQIALLIFLPFFTATLLPLLGGANADPQDFLEKEYI